VEAGSKRANGGETESRGFVKVLHRISLCTRYEEIEAFLESRSPLLLRRASCAGPSRTWSEQRHRGGNCERETFATDENNWNFCLRDRIFRLEKTRADEIFHFSA